MRCTIPDVDLTQKLDGTICRYKGAPVYVRVRDRQGQLDLYDCRAGSNAEAKFRIKSTDEEFDISSLPLGYMNQKDSKEVVYVSRIPARRTKQGVEGRSLRISSATGNGGGRAKYVDNIFFTKEFADMVEGIYPSLDSAIKELRGIYSKTSVVNLKEADIICQKAVSRNIALSINAMGNINVYFKDSWVGWIAPDEMLVRVPNNAMGWIVSRYLSHELAWDIQ